MCDVIYVICLIYEVMLRILITYPKDLRPVVDQSVSSILIRTLKVNHHTSRRALGRVLLLHWYAKGPRVWRHSVLVHL